MQPITDRLMGVLGPPAHVEDPAPFLAELERVAKAYTAECQELAGHMVLVATKQTWWPSLGVIADALNAAQDRLFAKRHDAGPKYPDWTPSRLANANRIIRSPMGQQAAKEGWIGALWDFCRVEERLPSAASEIARCKRISREADEKAQEVYRGEGGACSAALLRLCQSREERQRQFAEIANSYRAESLTDRSLQMAGEAQ